MNNKQLGSSHPFTILYAQLLEQELDRLEFERQMHLRNKNLGTNYVEWNRLQVEGTVMHSIMVKPREVESRQPKVYNLDNLGIMGLGTEEMRE